MILTVSHTNRADERQVLRGMFEARKRVFVDLLKWDLPVIADRYELDRFDDAHATYMILTDAERSHLASARLLDTRRPALLDSVFGALCDQPPPRGAHVREITRFCLSRDVPATARGVARDRLVSALVFHALDTGLSCYTGVADIGSYQQILGFGWDCRPLGALRRAYGQTLGAFAIAIDGDTPHKLQRAGILRLDVADAARAA
jgi:acyl-homoserine lactone synthase